MLSEKKTKENTLRFHLYIKSKKVKPIETKSKMVVSRAWGQGWRGEEDLEVDQRVQN